MMVEKTIEISGITEEDILYGIATLAGFSKISPFKRERSFWPEVNSLTLLTWNADSDREFMLQPPDIAASQVYEYNSKTGLWDKTDKYKVFVSEQVNPSVFNHLEERIREEYQKVA